jgi:hypothetical protein
VDKLTASGIGAVESFTGWSGPLDLLVLYSSVEVSREDRLHAVGLDGVVTIAVSIWTADVWLSGTDVLEGGNDACVAVAAVATVEGDQRDIVVEAGLTGGWSRHVSWLMLLAVLIESLFKQSGCEVAWMV